MTVRRGVGKIASKLASLRSIIVRKIFIFAETADPPWQIYHFGVWTSANLFETLAASTSTSSNLCKKRAKISTL